MNLMVSWHAKWHIEGMNVGHSGSRETETGGSRELQAKHLLQGTFHCDGLRTDFLPNLTEVNTSIILLIT